jgi:hypothetical protein
MGSSRFGTMVDYKTGSALLRKAVPELIKAFPNTDTACHHTYCQLVLYYGWCLMILLKSTYRVDYDRSSGERDEGWNLLVSVYDAPGILAAVCAMAGEVKARIGMYNIQYRM